MVLNIWGETNQMQTFKSVTLSIKLFPKSRFKSLVFLAKSDGIVCKSEMKQDHVNK
jgi:hypothetical protein